MDSLVSWLMDSPMPSIRYLTLRHLLGHGEADADVQAEREAIRNTGPIPRILKKQADAGHWEGDPNWYGEKYKGTHWSLMLLPELAADPDDPRLRRGVDFMLDITQQNYMLEDRFEKSVPSPAQFGFSCFWGNFLRYAAYFGAADDPRVQPIVSYLVRNLDEGGCQCHINDYLPCAWGAARSLWGLAALPNKSDAVNAAIEKTLSFLLDYRYPLAQGAYPAKNKISSIWAKLNFPLFYQADVLFTLRVLGDLHALDRVGVQPVLDWLERQRKPNGRWQGTSPFKARTWAIASDPDDTSRWVSLHAAIVLQQAAQREPVA
jgi:hypothetical protein